MLKRWFQWVKEFFGFDVPLPTPLPEDAWDLMFALKEQCGKLKLSGFIVTDYDTVAETYAAHIGDLFKRLEMVIKCIQTECETPAEWADRSRSKMLDTLPDFYYDPETGYHTPGEVLKILIEKVEVIHYLLDSKQMDAQHLYTPYLRKEFLSVISDTIEIFKVSQKISLLR